MRYPPRVLIPTSESTIATSPTVAAEAPLPASGPARPGLGVRLVRTLGWTLIWLGLLTLGFVVHQLFVTDVLARRHQVVLADQRIENNAAAVITEEVVPDPAGGESLRLIVESPPPLGEAFALIRIPSIPSLVEGWNVVEGVEVEHLRTGAGHMPNTPLPGQPGNAVISGHRTTYGAPFHELDTLVEGDRIEVDTAIGTHVYEVREVTEMGQPLEEGAGFVVAPTDVWVTDPLAGGWLTLTTCHPKFSARQRLIIRAELVDGPNAEVIRRLVG